MYSSKSPSRIPFLNHFHSSQMASESPIDSSLQDSEFEFSINSTTELNSCSADELFFNGVILPTHNTEGFVHSKRIHHQCEIISPFSSSSLPPLPPAAETQTSKKQNQKEFMAVDSEKKGRSKSFWGFRRSNSLTHESRKNSFFSLPLLSRSNSTGSVPTPKRTPLKQSSEGKSKSSFSSMMFSNSASNSYSKLPKSHSRKNMGRFYGNNVYITPILNIPPPYITKETADIFGLSSLLRSGKEKKSRK